MNGDRFARRMAGRAAALLLIGAGALIADAGFSAGRAQFTNLPITNLPATNPPVTNLPAAPPVTNLPATNPPVTNLPVTNLPVTNLPVAVAPIPPVAVDPGRIVNGPNALTRVEREFDDLRHTPRGKRPDLSGCNIVNGRCAKLWLVDDWRNTGKSKRARREASQPRRDAARTAPDPSSRVAADRNYVANQVLAEIDGSLSAAQIDALARRHRLQRLESRAFPLIDSTVALFRIDDRRSPQAVLAALGADARFRLAQLNFRYRLQDDKPAPAPADALQYALAKLRLHEAHALSRGRNVTVAVIDSGIDTNHPELTGAVAGSFNALGGNEAPHVHGTGVAGIIASHAQLTGGAPAAKLLAIRAFGVAQGRGESTSYVILKGIDYAAAHGARIVNMSFAGPNDPLIARGIAALAARDIVLVAASGNEGASSPPLYPAANPSVIAVGAADSADRLFPPSNRGSHIAVVAPGVEIFLAAPDGKYRTDSGTSFAAAFVSAVAALLLERDPGLKPDQVRTILLRTARDLGAPGRDDLFGAGEADALAAVSAARGAGQVATPAAAPAPAGALAGPSAATSPTADAALAAPAPPSAEPETPR
jgi:subtilisin family serine protease